MKIFVFSTHALWQPHLETELEIIQNHLNKGDTVYRFVCDGTLPVCDVNINHALSVCLKCKEMSLCGKSLLEGSIIDLPLINVDSSVKNKIDSFTFKYNSIQELKNIYADNFDVGVASLSSVISWLREPSLDVEKNRETIDDCLRSAVSVYYSALQYMQDLKPDRVYAFNGRLVHVKPVLRASEKMNVECFIHERGHNKDFYELYKNTTPHNREYVVSKMNELWSNADPTKRNEIGESFYKERAAGKSQGWYSFTDKQQKGLLPDNWNPEKRNVVIFNSSEDEFASIGDDWKNELYSSQLEAISEIISDCLKFNEIHFYLRVHPNLSNVNNSEAKTIKQLNFPNLTVIEAENPISTYDLLFNCEKILAFGSSVGIEAVFWGKPSIQAGKSYYFDMNATYKPKTHEETIQMIKAKQEPMDKTPALIYGYYFKTFGIEYKFYSAKNLATGLYKGVNIDEKAEKTSNIFKTWRSNFILKYPAYLFEVEYRKNKRRIPSFLLKKN
ncbi:MAG: hypothetical protein NTX97_07460 [Bacteroidetes bacterium]|nr:hypothetical protein [Bacteroidota bacterium]